ncbi:MAG: class I SAM-dependent methyltransferase [Candidatus Omnitrophica bacterium]|nr:class I SAM-dependent methyltransferase [Candidatus Omnitrophota bacterium]MDD5352366.1 class I SAM-dependent methyltransferase [Candidatus Omnitrophota bacterium]MDD5549964.1 class I SAM-dependent methyltransferase [Candidatus Omnitrophota bacterium]
MLKAFSNLQKLIQKEKIDPSEKVKIGRLIHVLGHISRPFFWEPIAKLFQKYLSMYYSHLQWRQWHKNPPHWGDHRIDLFTWPERLNSHWVERGIYSKELMRPDSKVLDIGCGDGFYAKYFYASAASTIDCLDIDQTAIKHAKKYNSHPKIRYFNLDAIKQSFPSSDYDVVCLDGSLAHFSSEELKILLEKIKKCLATNGVLVGYEEMEKEAIKSWDHKMVFSKKNDFEELFSPFFKYIKCIYLESPGRLNMYFRCSDDKSRIERFQ